MRSELSTVQPVSLVISATGVPTDLHPGAGTLTAVTMQRRLIPAGLLGRVTSLYGTVARGTS
jgi:hypothetical protein